ncbi:hypothetical protein LTS12_004495 [Elasticomyces elasticus]|nr:hypothetical protein LTS12_004495 [Elasticomyces elasticus]
MDQEKPFKTIELVDSRTNQGRYCCLIEPEQWNVLMALQKPAVEFFTSREALEARHATPTPMSAATMSVYSGSLRMIGSMPTTPAQLRSPMSMPDRSSPFSGYQSPPPVPIPRFGMMGLGAPQGNEQTITPNPLVWDGQAPIAPREYHRPSQYQIPEEEPRSCCQGPAVPQQEPQYGHYTPTGQSMVTPTSFASFDHGLPSASMPQPELPLPSTFDFDKLQSDFLRYQYPSAICQTCGLNGCTCRNCPPLMQDSANGSWAKCCGRKHARTAAYIPPTMEHTFQMQPATQAIPQLPAPNGGHHNEHATISPEPHDLDFRSQQLFAPMPPYGQHDQVDLYPPSFHPQPDTIPDFTPFDPGEAFALPEGDSNLAFNEFLMPDLDEDLSQGCCCGGEP